MRLFLCGVFAAVALIAFEVPGLGMEPGESAPVGAAAGERPFGLSKRVPFTMSRVIGTPEPAPPFRIKRVFPEVKLKSPVFIAVEPGTGQLLVTEVDGKILRLPANPNSAETDVFLQADPKKRCQYYSMTFHPRYEENGEIFVFSNQKTFKPARNRISRFKAVRPADGGPRRCLLESEQIIVEWESDGHDGGGVEFGLDGFLYIATGDSTVGSDPIATGQNLTDLLSVMIRIDVDHPEPGKPYAIPKDNPFLHIKEARPEIWAYGFRNPWRMSFDSKTGDLWVGDVGQDIWEMILRVEKGGNYGWSVTEGSHAFHPNKPKGPTPILPPVIEHHHTESRSITGGFVYHGDRFPELEGVYFYGDYEYGKIWGLKYDRSTKKVVWRKELADTAIKIPGFGLDPAGHIYVIDYSGHALYELERGVKETYSATFPRKLSETGLFASVKEHEVTDGVIPYSVKAPFWSDGAHKERYLAIPGEQKVDPVSTQGDDRESGAWTFEDGAIAVKSFAMDLMKDGVASRKYIETRLLVKQENHWLGYSYLWNDDQTDGTLVSAEGTDRVYEIRDTQAPTGSRKQTWHYPSRNECMVCHTRAAGFVLGLNTWQMNTEHDFGGVKDNQLRSYDHIGLFKQPLTKSPAEYPSLTSPTDATAELEKRVRSFLHINCAMCHVADGGGNSLMKLRITEKRENLGILDVRPIHETFGIADARIIAPGSPERSVLYHRVSRRGHGTGQMPPLASNEVDQEGLRLLREWITQLKPADERPKPIKSTAR